MEGTIGVAWIGSSSELARLAAASTTGRRMLTVATFNDLSGALAHNAAWNAQVCIVEEDLLPRHGLGLVNGLRATQADLRFLLLGDHAHMPRVHAALIAGVDGLLPYNARPADLHGAIRTVAGGDVSIPASILTTWVQHLRGLHAPPADGLSAREQEVLHLLAQGLTYKGIGEQLHISAFTVKNHVHRILAKLGVRTRMEAVRRFLHYRHGEAVGGRSRL
jgi:DNA-binding NarL/FixJ family response regulator